jgi:penicillin-binding protein 1A
VIQGASGNMASDKRKRIEPRFDGGTLDDEDGSFRVDASDRIGGPVSTSRKSSAKGGAGGKKPAAKRSAAKRKPAGKRRSSGGFFKKFFWGSLYWGAVAGVWAFIGIAGVLAWYAATLPSVSEWAVPQRPPNVEIVGVDGELIGNRGETGGEVVRLEQLPAYLPQAVMAIEDRRFYSHFGVDVFGLARAAFTNFTAGRVVQGGSTLTQQLAKNLFLTPERTIDRKMREVVMALWLEMEFTKDEIMEMYLNRVYLGAGAYGVDAAARTYYNKSANEVTLAEAATIAGLLKAPSRFAPSSNPRGAAERASVVLTAMADEGYISEKDATIALTNPARATARPREGSNNYVADWVMDQLDEFIGEINTDIKVYTTIDPALQQAAEAALRQGLAELGKEDVQGAIVAADGTGAVRAMVGGESYAESEFNRAVNARRQPGSAFKPFVYLAGLESGMSPQMGMNDQPVTIGNWTPKNYGDRYRGVISLADALALSSNTVAAQVAAQAGPDRVAAAAYRLGITSDLIAQPSIALGTSEVSPLEMVEAYVPFANGGFGVVPHVIDRIVDDNGNILYQRQGAANNRIIAFEHASAMNGMLARTLLIGTGRKAQLDNWMAAGKTGTTQDSRDAWFVGYTANLTAGVWLGRDDSKPMGEVTGGSAPAVIWKNFMTAAHQGLEPRPLPGVDAAYLASLDVNAVLSGRAQPQQQGQGRYWNERQGEGGVVRDTYVDNRGIQPPAPVREAGEAIGGFLRNLFGR